MKLLFVLSGLVLFMLTGCGLLSSDGAEGEDFFPLKVGQKWTYQISESKPGLLSRFTVSVIDEAIVDNKNYYLVTNYFTPKGRLPDTILVRNAESKVFMRLSPEDEEILFYAFTPEDTTWSVPMYASSTMLFPFPARLDVSSENKAIIKWDWDGRARTRWQETFKRGRGRTEILHIGGPSGKVVWKLDN